MKSGQTSKTPYPDGGHDGETSHGNDREEAGTIGGLKILSDLISC